MWLNIKANKSLIFIMKQVVLFLTNRSDEWTLSKFRTLELAQNESTDIYILYHQSSEIVPEAIKKTNHYPFTNDILYSLGYQPINSSLLPGSNHFPLLKFYLEHSHYEYYWLVEDDVCFTGKWSDFFSYHSSNPADLLSSIVRRYTEVPYWGWWNSLQIESENIPLENRVRSFNPIYRLSNSALKCIDHALQNGWSGHHEVLIPTLLYNRNYALSDIGGNGTFVPKNNTDRFYKEESTMSHLPVELGDKPNFLYHPVKEKKRTSSSNNKKYCVISAVGKESLHKEWIAGNPDFDLHLLIYDQSFNKFYNDADFISCQKGYKFKLVYNYLQKNPDFLNQYEYFFIPDDDISMDTENISKLFRYMKKYNLEIAQPALSQSYYSHEHTLRDRSCILRYTNFVEMMMPCFSQKAFRKVFHTFNENESGWGIDYHWAQLIGSSGKDMAVIDAIVALHTRSVQSNNKMNRNELKDYIKKYNLNNKIKEIDFIPDLLNQSKGNKPPIINRSEIHKIKKKITELDFRIKHIVKSDIMYPIGLNGLTGLSLFLTYYSRESEKKKYEDWGLLLADKIIERSLLIKNNFSFNEGLPGLAWYIEYLSQSNFIENQTDEILELPCTELNQYYLLNIMNIKEVLELVPHYLARAQNSMHLKTNDFTLEKQILSRIILSISQYLLNKKELNTKYSWACIFILYQAEKTSLFPDIKSQLKGIIERLASNINSLDIIKKYILFRVSDLIEAKEIKFGILKNIYQYKIRKHENFYMQLIVLHCFNMLSSEINETKLNEMRKEISNTIFNKSPAILDMKSSYPNIAIMGILLTSNISYYQNEKINDFIILNYLYNEIPDNIRKIKKPE